MLQTIRDRASGWIAYIIVGLLVIPFALWGINSYFAGPGPLVVAKVGDSEISLQEFQRVYQQQYQQQRLRLQNLLGEDFDPALLEGLQLKQQVLQDLINQRLLLQTAQARGLRASDEQLSQTIQSYPVFQQEGRFDRERYENLLRSQGFSKVAFEESERNALILGQLQEGLLTSAVTVPKEVDNLISLMNQKRDLAYIVLALEDYLAEVEVEEQAIKAYYEENKDRFMNPEQVKLSYLELDQETLAENISVGEDELRAVYQEQIAKYVQPEERSASHILVTVSSEASEEDKEQARARAQSLYEKITAGDKTFMEVLEEVKGEAGIEGGELGVITQGMLDPAFESALYDLEAVGDISPPVQSGFGFHIIRLDDIIPEQRRSFDEVRGEVAQDIRQREAEARFYDAAETLTNLSYERPDTLEPVAQALDLEIKESDWLTRNSNEGIAAYPEVRRVAFSEDVLQQRLNSQPIEVEPGRVIVVRVQDYKEATPLSLEEARDDIVSLLRRRQAREMLEKDSAMIQEQIAQGQDLASLAEQFDGELKQPELVGRNASDIDNAVLAEAFQLPKPAEDDISVGSTALNNGDQAVVVVRQVVPGTVEDYPEAEREALAQRLTQQRGLAQFQGFVDGLRQETEVVTYPDRLP